MCSMTLSHLQTQVVPWKLWSMVGCLVLADAVFLTVWQLVDPLKKSVQQKIVGNLRYHIFQENHDFWNRVI